MTWAGMVEAFPDVSIVFEVRGTLLDETHGFTPYVTPSNTTFDMP